MKKFYGFLFIYFFALCAPASGQADFVIRNYQTNLKLDPDGRLEVREIIKVYFEVPRHGIKRDIPLKYHVDPQASGQMVDRFFDHELLIQNIRIKGIPFSTTRLGNGIQLKIGDPDKLVEGEQVYDIQYIIYNGLLHGNQKTELYWNLVGDQWEVPIEEAGFVIEVPPGLSIGEKDFEIRTGNFGSTQEFSSARWENNVLTGRSLVALGNGHGMTVAIRMPVGSIQSYPAYKLWIYHGKYLVLPIAMIISFFMIWRRYGWDKSQAEVVAYLPPKGFDAAMAGFAIDIRANVRDALSIIPDLGSRGFLQIEHQKKEHFWEDDKITFIKLKNLPTDAPAHQKLFFDGLFECGSKVELKDLKNEFYKTLSATQSAISDAIMHSNHFTRESKKFYWNSFWVIAVAGMINSIWCFMGAKFFILALTIALSIVFMLIAYVLLKRSDQGDLDFREVRGLKKFIELAEKDKIEFLVKDDPGYFDKILPYAVAFNCTDTWCKKFEGLQQTPPRWFHSNHSGMFFSNGHFNASAFQDTLSSSLSEMRTVLSSTPSSSGSSSGGGGSFSGGGFGGGGGSSW